MLSSFRIDSGAVFPRQFCYEPAEAYLSAIHVGVARTSHPSLPNFWLLALLDVDILRPAWSTAGNAGRLEPDSSVPRSCSYKTCPRHNPLNLPLAYCSTRFVQFLNSSDGETGHHCPTMMRKTCVFRAKNSARVSHYRFVSTSVSADERDAG
jgi:hypothetical protein